MHLVLLVLTIFLFKEPVFACTNDSYSVAASSSVDIDECGTCRKVTNNTSAPIFVPTRTNVEWTAFYTNASTNTSGSVIIGGCGPCSYPLDTVAAPAAAYSLRKLRTSYVGPLIQVRRSSDNAVLDIPASSSGCGALDTAALLTFVGAGSGFVRTWYDQGTGSRHAIQTTAGNQPRIVLNGVLDTKFGQTMIFFNGSTFIPGVALGIAATSSWSYSMVLGSTTTTNGLATDGTGTYYLDRTTATPGLTGLKVASGRYMLQKRTDASTLLAGISSTTNVSTTAIQAVYNERIYNSSFNLYLNNVLEGTLAETNGALTPPTPNIGRHTSTTTTANFAIYEFIFWGSALSSGDRATIYNSQRTAFSF
jgi:hypothetical protein